MAVDTRRGSNAFASLFTPVSQMGGSQHFTMVVECPFSPLSSQRLTCSFKLDLCDPVRSFETVVPLQAMSSQILFNAVLAFAARHKANTISTDLYQESAYEYQRRCLRSLIKRVSLGQEGLEDDNMFAATIILRVVEEMERRLDFFIPDFPLVCLSCVSPPGSRLMTLYSRQPRLRQPTLSPPHPGIHPSKSCQADRGRLPCCRLVLGGVASGDLCRRDAKKTNVYRHDRVNRRQDI